MAPSVAPGPRVLSQHSEQGWVGGGLPYYFLRGFAFMFHFDHNHEPGGAGRAHTITVIKDGEIEALGVTVSQAYYPQKGAWVSASITASPPHTSFRITATDIACANNPLPSFS